MKLRFFGPPQGWFSKPSAGLAFLCTLAVFSWLILSLGFPAVSQAAPSVQNDVAGTPFNTPVMVFVQSNDSGDWIGGSFTQPANGTVTGVLSGPGLLYKPNLNFVGTDTFTYSSTDSGGSTLTATVEVTVDSTAPNKATFPTFTCQPSDEICNVARSAGVGNFVSYGRGAAFVDINGDGWDDIFAVDNDGRFDPNDFGVSKFFLNQGNGIFLVADLGVADSDLWGAWVGSFADYDNDGDPDMLLGNGGFLGDSFLSFYVNEMNTSGQLVPATDTSGIGVANNKANAWWCASWADYDNDGFVDLAITRLLDRPLLFHNDNGVSFTEVGLQMGIDIVFQKIPEAASQKNGESGKNPVWIDYDHDGDMDLYIAGIYKHAFYENVGGTQFVDVTSVVFANIFPPNINFPAGFPLVFAAAAEDFNQDGKDDLYLGRWDEQDLVLINDGTGTFTPMGREAGLDALNTQWLDPSLQYENTMGLGVGDLFNDGFPDLYIGSGTTDRADNDILYCNKPGGFKRCTHLLTANASKDHRTRAHGTVFADVNHDGNTDIFINLGGASEPGKDTREENALWVRQPAEPASTATLTLEGTTSNRDAIGARVHVQAGSRIHYYTIRSTQAFQSQNSNALVVTLGNAPSGNARVFWPSGATTDLTLSVGQRVHVVEPAVP